MSVKRSPEMVLVGYFLARCGRTTSSGNQPPPQLGTDHWGRTYAAFFDTLGDGRTLKTFINSLKNSRDLFDSHVNSGRVGWRRVDDKSEPQPLTAEAQRVFDRWARSPDEELWAEVSRFADVATTRIDKTVLDDALSELASDETSTAKTEGGRRMHISTRVERNPRLRDDAIRINGTSCAVCEFNYGAFYGEWGEGFVEVHHLEPLGESDDPRETNPQTDLIVLCANCHRMVHRKLGIVLTTDELRRKINIQAAQAWAARLGQAT